MRTIFLYAALFCVKIKNIFSLVNNFEKNRFFYLKNHFFTIA